ARPPASWAVEVIIIVTPAAAAPGPVVVIVVPARAFARRFVVIVRDGRDRLGPGFWRDGHRLHDRDLLGGEELRNFGDAAAGGLGGPPPLSAGGVRRAQPR